MAGGSPIVSQIHAFLVKEIYEKFNKETLKNLL